MNPSQYRERHLRLQHKATQFSTDNASARRAIEHA